MKHNNVVLYNAFLRPQDYELHNPSAISLYMAYFFLIAWHYKTEDQEENLQAED